jgi:hypothetical protein
VPDWNEVVHSAVAMRVVTKLLSQEEKQIIVAFEIRESVNVLKALSELGE